MNTESKHTPGNWHRGIGNGEGCIFADAGRMRAEGDRGTVLYPICQVVHRWSEAEDKANEQLIACAPELLAALQLCSSLLSETEFAFHPANVRAKQAIAKAIGD